MPDGSFRRSAVAAVLASALLGTPHHADAGGAPGALLRCRGALQFSDALARAATVFVDLERGRVTTPDCRKYPHFERYCTGVLLDIAEHSFQFGGAVSPENTKFWADLYRPSTILPATAAGPAVEAMRVLFLGRCEPARARGVLRARSSR
jgi:hypothetical protein